MVLTLLEVKEWPVQEMEEERLQVEEEMVKRRQGRMDARMKKRRWGLSHRTSG